MCQVVRRSEILTRWSFRINLIRNISKTKQVAEHYRRSRKTEKAPRRLFLLRKWKRTGLSGAYKLLQINDWKHPPAPTDKSEGSWTCLCWKTCFSGKPFTTGQKIIRCLKDICNNREQQQSCATWRPKQNSTPLFFLFF